MNPMTQPRAMPMTERKRQTRSSSRCSPKVIVVPSNRSSLVFLAVLALAMAVSQSSRHAPRAVNSAATAHRPTLRVGALVPGTLRQGRVPECIQTGRYSRKLPYQRRAYGGKLPYQVSSRGGPCGQGVYYMAGG